jgi:ATP-binding cassette subfamily B (MDR/TAP) protein 1
VSTTAQAINTAVPSTPPQTFNAYLTPPSSYNARLNEVVELRNLPHSTPPHASPQRKKESPFHDRHSVAVDAEPLNEATQRGSPYQRAMPGYLFAGMGQDRGDDKEELAFGGELDEPTHISAKRRSLYPTQSVIIPSSTLQDHPDLYRPIIASAPPKPPRSGPPPIRARFRLLFSLSDRRDICLILLPAIVLSIAASVTPPYMSSVIGDAFEIFALYPLETGLATQAQRDALSSGIREKSTLLAAAGLYAVAINYAKTVMWQWHGEMIAGKLRQKVFEGVQIKQMAWFDMGMGMREDDLTEGESIGAGGLMAKFTK